MSSALEIRDATAAERPAVATLLAGCGLDGSDLDAGVALLVAVRNGAVLGSVALEGSGGVRLLRSLAVAAEGRSAGIGAALLDAAVRRARSTGSEALYLLTTTAAPYFAARGWEAVARETAPPPVRASRQFTALCPATASLMRRSLAPRQALMLCTGNSARSILGEVLLNARADGHLVAHSAGSQPRGSVHPQALALLADKGLPTAGLRSKSWSEFAAPGAPLLDLVFTVCDAAGRESCPLWPGSPVRAHWGLPDPAVPGDDAAGAAQFAAAFETLDRRIGQLLALPFEGLPAAVLQRELQRIGRS